MKTPEALQHRGTVRVAWYRATATREIVIGYPDPTPNKVHPEGTTGWFSKTSIRGGSFYPDTEPLGHSGIATGEHGFTFEEDPVYLNYNLQDRYYEEGES